MTQNRQFKPFDIFEKGSPKAPSARPSRPPALRPSRSGRWARPRRALGWAAALPSHCRTHSQLAAHPGPRGRFSSSTGSLHSSARFPLTWRRRRVGRPAVVLVSFASSSPSHRRPLPPTASCHRSKAFCHDEIFSYPCLKTLACGPVDTVDGKTALTMQP